MFSLEQAAGALFGPIVSRALPVPSSARVVAIGGATLGGSGKTPLAIACAAELAAAGARVSLVGHAYRAVPHRPRFVSTGDPLDDVGDEALVAARALESCGARVVVAPSRAAAIAWAAESADVLVLDGVAQLRPVRAALALLSVDARDPWGRGRLRRHAPIRALVEACDVIVPMDGLGNEATDDGTGGVAGEAAADEGHEASDADEVNEVMRHGRSVWPSRVESRGACVDGGTLMTWEALRAIPIGLVTALARPERLVAALGRHGIVPQAVVEARDHGPFGKNASLQAALAARRHGVALWLATPKCAMHVARGLPELSVAVIERRLSLHPALRIRLRGLLQCDGRGGREQREQREQRDEPDAPEPCAMCDVTKGVGARETHRAAP